MSIHFVTVTHQQPVHAGALGFTNTTYWYAWAADPQRAEQICADHCASIGAPVESVPSCRPAVNQDLSTYTLPESILGLPLDLLRQALTKKRMPSDWVDAAMAKATARMHRSAARPAGRHA